VAPAGRRPGPSRTREAILEAAREEFARGGFDATTVRAIAARAGVDAAMIAHHFGSKQQLVLAALRVPFDPAVEIGAVLDGDPEELGVRLLTRLLQVWDSPAGAGAVAALRGALAKEETTALIREVALHQVLGPVVQTLDVTPAERRWRANLLATQLVGLVVARYLLRLEPLASTAPAVVVASLAPTVQRYLTGVLAPDTPG
jgi:AcrR family transcriptional regulator